jgi:predicted Zn-dependent peptidase
MEDLNAASVEDVAQFFKTYYAPNNAVLSLVGDFKPADAMAMIKRYFEDIPRQPEPPAVDLSEPEQKAERRETMTDALARATQIQIAYKTPVGNATDVYALRVLSSVLQSGDSSRLYQLLNKEKELVVAVGGFVDERIGPGGLYIGATVRPGKKADDVEAAIYAEIEKLQQQPIAQWELEKAKNTTRFGYLQSIRNAQSRATQLGIFTVKFNDPGLINSRVTGFEAVTRDDVQRVAKKYLQAQSRTVIVTNPAPQPAAAPGA